MVVWPERQVLFREMSEYLRLEARLNKDAGEDQTRTRCHSPVQQYDRGGDVHDGLCVS
jgi:hypothetical protein